MARVSAALPLEHLTADRLLRRLRLLVEEVDPSVQPAPPGKLARFASRIAVAMAVLLFVAVAGLAAVRASFNDEIYPSVFVAHVDVGGLTVPEAEADLATAAESFADTRMTLSYRDHVWTPSFQDLGFAIDTRRTLDAAFAVGREPAARARMSSAFDLVGGETNVPLLVALDEPVLDGWFDRVDNEIDRPPRNAKLVIKQGDVTVKNDVDGKVVDRTKAREIISTSVRRLLPYAGKLPVVSRPAKVQAEDIAGVRETLSLALAKPVKVTHGKRTWKLTGADLGRFVVQEATAESDGGPTIAVSLDEKALAKWLTALLGDEVNREPRDAVIAWGGDGIIALEDSVDGAKLKPITLSKSIARSLFGDHESVKVPVVVTEPKVDSGKLKSLGITNRLAVGDSSFAGSDDARATNIYVGTALLNGTVVPPGEDFSFNRAIGEISAELGYVEAGVVDGERIGKDIGGGICQVSTTVFRAAFHAGLPIVEWHPHRYRLGFYEQDGWKPGLDASILQPEGRPFEGGDFRFHNPTDSWLLVEAYTDGPRVFVIIYGPNLGYDVQISEPWIGPDAYPPTEDVEVVDGEAAPGTVVQTEWQLAGMDVSYQRTVYDRKGNVVLDEPFSTHFYARGNVYKVSPDMQGQSPASN